jgi:hypothetical protein
MSADPISWERLRGIFGDPQPVLDVCERQFDYNDDELRQLARTPYDRIEASQLWYYFHDLSHVELQPELFAYLFPVCLMNWHCSLLADKPCAYGDAEFHKALRHGGVLDKMLTDKQRLEVFDIFRDSFLYRLDLESALPVSVNKEHFLAWLLRFNSLGMSVPIIETILPLWWGMVTRGRAISALIYCSGFVYESVEDNPALAFSTQLPKNVGPLPIWENDSLILHCGWLPSNVSFLQHFLSFNVLIASLENVRCLLSDSTERRIVNQVCTDLLARREFVESRVLELPRILTEPDTMEWSV